MEIVEILSSAFEALAINRLRTGLATLGIIIGIGAVIALVSIGQSGQKSVEAQIQSLGSNLLTVIPGTLRPGDIRSAAGTSTTLTWDDAKAIIKDSSTLGIKNVSPELLRRSQVTAGGKNVNTQILGATQVYKEVKNISMDRGTFLSQGDVDSGNKVAVLGPQVVSDLFGSPDSGGTDPIGQTIRINKMAFKVIGVTVSKGGAGFSNQDDSVFVPLSVAQKQLFGVNFVGTISIEVLDPEKMDEARDKIGYFLLARHKIQNPQNADFTIISQADILGAATQITGIFTTLLSGIAAISLLVGGIGIMNIMLVTVTERTREIGLRKALGAKKQAIVTQFLIESIILTFVGGILGMIFGMVLSFIASFLLKLPFVLSFSSVVLAIGVSGGIGILFGWYPARLAANMSPIEALRYE